MFDRVLVGVDGREGGRDAIALARKVAAPTAEITLAHVYGGRTMGGRAAALSVPLELEGSEGLLRDAATAWGGHVHTVPVYESSVGRGLRELAEQHQADLIVVGSCHRSTLGQAFLGNDTIGALKHAPCTLAIAQRGLAAAPAEDEPWRIGVGCDDTDQSRIALDVARALAAREGEDVWAMTVVSLDDLPPDGTVPDDWPKIAAQLVDEGARRLSRLDGVRGDASYGDPAEELITFSKRLELLVVGARGAGAVSRLLEGSVSRDLAKRARCSLLVLREDSRLPGGVRRFPVIPAETAIAGGT